MAIERVVGANSLRRKLTNLERHAYPTAIARATNRVANTVKSRTAVDIAEATGLKPSSVRRKIVFTKRATKADPSAVLEISGRPFNLVEFVSGSKSPRRPRGGVTANAWGRSRKYPGVFLARMPNGQVIAVQRSRAGRGARNRVAIARDRFLGGSGPKLIQRGRWAGKSPHIEAVFGAGIAREAAQPMLTQQRERTVAERMPIELKHEMKFAIQRMLVRSVRGRGARR
jgi:hypothetical protein